MSRSISSILVVLLTTLMLVSPAFGQGTTSFGVKGGLNFANLGGSDVEGLDSKTGFALGGFANFGLSDIVAFQPEVLYTAKGAQQKVSGFGETVTVKINLTYLELPLLLVLNIPVENAQIKPQVFAGPSLAFNLSAKSKGEGSQGSAEEDIDDVKSVDFGLVFGAGIGIPVGANTVMIGVRYNLGLSSIDDSADNLDIKNRVLAIDASFGFGGGEN